MASKEPDGADEHPITVLLVEAEPLARLFWTDVLEEHGFAVIEAGSADEALRVLETRDDVHILFSDITIGGPAGLELARRLHDRWPLIAVVPTSDTAKLGPDEMLQGGWFVHKLYNSDTVVAALHASRTASARQKQGPVHEAPSELTWRSSQSGDNHDPP